MPRGTATKEAIEQLGLSEGQVLYKCQKCCSIKPERAHHCSVCQRCIRKMDRKLDRMPNLLTMWWLSCADHCPWVNNCVGENNQKFFVLFTVSRISNESFKWLSNWWCAQLYIAVISCHALLLSVTHFYKCIENDWKSMDLITFIAKNPSIHSFIYFYISYMFWLQTITNLLYFVVKTAAQHIAIR